MATSKSNKRLILSEDYEDEQEDTPAALKSVALDIEDGDQAGAVDTSTIKPSEKKNLFERLSEWWGKYKGTFEIIFKIVVIVLVPILINKLDDMDGQIEQLDAKLETIEDKANDLQTNITSMDTKVEDMAPKVEEAQRVQNDTNILLNQTKQLNNTLHQLVTASLIESEYLPNSFFSSVLNHNHNDAVFYNPNNLTSKLQGKNVVAAMFNGWYYCDHCYSCTSKVTATEVWGNIYFAEGTKIMLVVDKVSSCQKGGKTAITLAGSDITDYIFFERMQLIKGVGIGNS